MNAKLSLVLSLMVALAFPTGMIIAGQSEGSNTVPEGTEFARDTAIDYVLQNHEELRWLKAPSSWRVQNLNPEMLPGLNKQQYTSRGWTIKVSNAVVLEPTYTVEIEYMGEVSFHWKGTVDQSGNVDQIA